MSGFKDHHHVRIIDTAQVWNGCCHYEFLVDTGRKDEGEMLCCVEEEVIHTSVKRVAGNGVRLSWSYIHKEGLSMFGIAGKNVDGGEERKNVT